jgi:hypothetical protein
MLIGDKQIIYKGTDASCKKVFIFQQLTAPSSE